MSSWSHSLRKLTEFSTRNSLQTWTCLSGQNTFQKKTDMEKDFLCKWTLRYLNTYTTSFNTSPLPPVTRLFPHQVCLPTCKKCTNRDMVKQPRAQHQKNSLHHCWTKKMWFCIIQQQRCTLEWEQGSPLKKCSVSLKGEYSKVGYRKPQWVERLLRWQEMSSSSPSTSS